MVDAVITLEVGLAARKLSCLSFPRILEKTKSNRLFFHANARDCYVVGIGGCPDLNDAIDRC